MSIEEHDSGLTGSNQRRPRQHHIVDRTLWPMSDSDQGLSRLDRAAQRTVKRLNEIESRLRAYQVQISPFFSLGTLMFGQVRLDTQLQTTDALLLEVASTSRQLDVGIRLLLCCYTDRFDFSGTLSNSRMPLRTSFRMWTVI
jgi:hypothetical protein